MIGARSATRVPSAHLDPRDRAAVHAVRRELRRIDLDSPFALPSIVEPIRAHLDLEIVGAYQLEPTPDGYAIGIAGGAGTDVEDMRRVFAPFLRQRGWGVFDPGAPDPRQRNVVVSLTDVYGLAKTTAIPIVRDAYPKLGWDGRDQIRVLVCEGPSLLCNIGGFSSDPISARQVRMLRALVGALRERLVVERNLTVSPRLSLALDAALEAIGAAAYVLAPSGALLHANAAGRCNHERLGREATRDAIARAREDSSWGWSITELRAHGLPPLILAIDRTSLESQRVEVAAARWGLTKRQREVLILVGRGLSNRTIAAELGLHEKTVESHIKAIFDKAGLESRAALIARLGGH